MEYNTGSRFCSQSRNYIRKSGSSIKITSAIRG